VHISVRKELLLRSFVEKISACGRCTDFQFGASAEYDTTPKNYGSLKEISTGTRVFLLIYRISQITFAIRQNVFHDRQFDNPCINRFGVTASAAVNANAGKLEIRVLF
jgi:hypothetical protein